MRIFPAEVQAKRTGTAHKNKAHSVCKIKQPNLVVVKTQHFKEHWKTLIFNTRNVILSNTFM